MTVVFPLRFQGGTLYKAREEAEYVEGKILQTLLIARGEFPPAPDYGVPFMLFTSRQNFQQDLARVEQILSIEVPEATVRVTGELLEGGVALIQVAWDYQSLNGVLEQQVEF